MEINQDSVGKFFTTNGHDIWKCIMYCSQPTATFENIENKYSSGGAVSSPVVTRFIELVPIQLPTKPREE